MGPDLCEGRLICWGLQNIKCILEKGWPAFVRELLENTGVLRARV